jgi:lipopolysaccharide biosynthesis glycosyltransferase
MWAADRYARSLLYANPNEHFVVWVLNSSLEAQDFSAMSACVDRGRCEIRDVKIDHAQLRGAPVTGRYPREMYYRIFAAHYLPDTLERVLYLDPDLVVINPIRALYATNLDGHYLAAASHVAKSLQKINALRLKISPPGPYINSGVMLMNLALLRETQRLDEVFSYMKKTKTCLFARPGRHQRAVRR